MLVKSQTCPENVIFLCFTIFFQVVFVPVIISCVIFCLFILRCDQRHFFRQCSWIVSYKQPMLMAVNSFSILVVELVIEQVQFSSRNAAHLKDWDRVLVTPAQRWMLPANTLSSMISVDIFLMLRLCRTSLGNSSIFVSRFILFVGLPWLVVLVLEAFFTWLF